MFDFVRLVRKNSVRNGKEGYANSKWKYKNGNKEIKKRNKKDYKMKNENELKIKNEQEILSNVFSK